MTFQITRSSSRFAGTDWILSVEFNQSPPQFSVSPQAGQLSAFGTLTFLENYRIRLDSEQGRPGRLTVERLDLPGVNLTFATIAYTSKGFIIRIPCGTILADAIASTDTQFTYQLEVGLRRGFDPIASQSIFDVQPYSTELFYLTGTEGNDLLNGSLFRNVVQGLGGNDQITTYGGDDLVWGGEGSDQINTGSGSDYLFGDGGNDVIVVKNGRDIVFGGTGSDRITTELTLFSLPARNSQLNGDAGNDVISGSGTLNGGDGIDLLSGWGILNGDTGADRLTSSNTFTPLFIDIFNGGSGNDSITASDGQDILDGGEGNDVLDGYGNFFRRSGQRAVDIDRLTGGAGQDNFVLGGAGDPTSSNLFPFYLESESFATIVDFQLQQDRITLQGSADQYRLVAGAGGTRILYSNSQLGVTNELIAVIANVTSGLSLKSASFVYV